MDQEVAKTLGELEIKLQELERELTSIGKRDAQPSKLLAPGKLIDEAVESDSAGTANAERHTGAWTAHAEQYRTGGPNANLDDEQERAVDNAFGGPAVFGGEEVPAQGATIERDSAFSVSETAYGEIATGSAQPPAASFPPGVFAPATSHIPEPGSPQPGSPPPPPGPPLPPPAQTPWHSSSALTGGTFPSTPAETLPTAPPGSSSLPATPIPQPPPSQPPPPQPIDRAELVRFKEKLQRTMEELVDEYGKLLLPKPPA
jgi:hypothetical protein